MVLQHLCVAESGYQSVVLGEDKQSLQTAQCKEIRPRNISLNSMSYKESGIKGTKER